MIIINKKNLFISSLVVLLCLVCYLNYSIGKYTLLETSQELKEYEENQLATNITPQEEISEKTKIEEIVSNQEPNNNNVTDTSLIVDSQTTPVKDMIAQKVQSIETNLKQSENTNFFIGSRLNINMEREKMLFLLNEIIDNKNTDADTVKLANKEKLFIIDIINKEKIVENLIRAKGFEDVVVFITKHSVNVIVQSKELPRSDMAKILDIVTRETNSSLDNIKISNKS